MAHWQTTFQAVDASGYRLDVAPGALAGRSWVYVPDPNGTRYSFAPPSATEVVADTNGNQIVITSYVRNRPTVMEDPYGHKGDCPKNATCWQEDLGNGLTANYVRTTTTVFHEDGSATLTSTTTETLTIVDPNTGKSSTVTLKPRTEEHEIGRSSDAIPLFRQNLAQGPATADKYASFSLVLEQALSLNEAEEMARKLWLDNRSKRSHQQLDSVLSQLHKTEEAERERKLADQLPESH